MGFLKTSEQTDFYQLLPSHSGWVRGCKARVRVRGSNPRIDNFHLIFAKVIEINPFWTEPFGFFDRDFSKVFSFYQSIPICFWSFGFGKKRLASRVSFWVFRHCANLFARRNLFFFFKNLCFSDVSSLEKNCFRVSRVPLWLFLTLRVIWIVSQ